MIKLLFLIFLLLGRPLIASNVVGPYEATLMEVIDGDTIRVEVAIWVKTYKMATIRVFGIDSPELKGKCEKEKELALKAKALATELLSTAEKITITEIKPDKYGDRWTAKVFYTKNGREYDFAKRMLRANLAGEYYGKGAKKNWCTE